METELIRIHWHVDRTGEIPMYMLVCDDPAHADLQVSASSEEMTERVAKAKLALGTKIAATLFVVLSILLLIVK